MSNLERKFFLIFKNGDSIGPKISISLILLNLIFISLAPCRLRFLSLDVIIIAINLKNGGNLFFFLIKILTLRSCSDLFLIKSFSI